MATWLKLLDRNAQSHRRAGGHSRHPTPMLATGPDDCASVAVMSICAYFTALLEPISEVCAVGDRHSGHFGCRVADSELVDPVVFVGHIVRPESGTPAAIE